MSNPLFKTLIDLETITNEIKMALDALALYSEHMDLEIGELDDTEIWTTRLFLQRYPRADATLQICRSSLHSSLNKMNETIDSGFSRIKSLDESACCSGKGGEVSQ